MASVPLASFTLAKLRWVVQHEKDNAAATAGVRLPHDWLTWRLRAGLGVPSAALQELVTYCSDATGTGYFSGVTGTIVWTRWTRAAQADVVAAPGARAVPAVGGTAPGGQVLGPVPGTTRPPCWAWAPSRGT